MAWRALVGLSLVGALVVALVPAPATAGGLCRNGAVSYGYAAPAVAYSYAAPAYQQVYLKAVKVAVSPDYYSSVSDYYRDRLLVDAVAGKALEMSKMQLELQSLRQQLQQYQQPLPQQQPPYSPPPQQMPPANGHGHHGNGYPQQPPQSYGAVPEKLPDLLEQKCLRCHGGTKDRAGGGLDLRNPQAVDPETRLLCYAACATGEMPKGSATLSPEERQVFLDWYNAARRPQARR